MLKKTSKAEKLKFKNSMIDAITNLQIFVQIVGIHFYLNFISNSFYNI